MTQELALPQLSTVQLISNARRALAEARTLPDFRHVMEAATVAADAAKRAAKLMEAQGVAAEVVKQANEAANDAAAVRIEAQAGAGRILREMDKNPGGQPSESSDVKSRQDRPTTAQVLGMSEDAARAASSRWQKVADIADNVRVEYVDEVKEKGGEITTAGLLRYASAKDDESEESVPSAEERLDAAYLAVTKSLATLLQYRADAVAVHAANSRRRKRFSGLVSRTQAWLEEAEQVLS